MTARVATAVLLALASLAATTHPSLLVRRYHDGEKISYTMTGSNQSDTFRIRASGVVAKDASGNWFEEIKWSDLVVNNEPQQLRDAEPQRLSLAAGAVLAMPNLAKVDHRLIGPITDLLTFYADWQIASGCNLTKPGDHAVVPLRFAPSWADGRRITLGEDSFDFDVTLQSLDDRDIVVVVRHVPPAKPLIKLPAEWMRTPVADTPNNWVEVQKNSDNTYAARVGKETFDVTLTIDRATGRIRSATLDNLVEVLERSCPDAELSKPGEPKHFQIKRKIAIE